MISTLARKAPGIALGVALALLSEIAIAVRVHDVAASDDASGLDTASGASDTLRDLSHLSSLAAWAPSFSGFLEQVEANRNLAVAGSAEESQRPVDWPQGWRKKLEKAKMVGQGAFGKVYVARIACAPGQSVAVKEQTFKTRDEKKSIQKEIKLMEAFSGPEFVSIFDSSEAGRSLNIMMEAASGDLSGVLKKAGVRTGVKYQLFVEMLRGVAVMHQKGFIHRDLKPANILVSGKCGSEPCHAKVADLGLSCSHSGQISKCDGIGGTPLFMAPETLRYAASRSMRYKDGVQDKNDVWALGLIFYEMLFGRLPSAIANSNTMDALQRNIKNFKIQDDREYKKQDDALKELFQNMLAPQPQSRSSAAEALRNAEALARRMGADFSDVQAAGSRLPDCWLGIKKTPDVTPPVIQPAKAGDDKRPAYTNGQRGQGGIIKRAPDASPPIGQPVKAGDNKPPHRQGGIIKKTLDVAPPVIQPAKAGDKKLPAFIYGQRGQGGVIKKTPDATPPFGQPAVVDDDDDEGEDEFVFLTFARPSTNMKVNMLEKSWDKDGVIKIPDTARAYSHSQLRDGDIIEEIAGVPFSDITASTWSLIKEGAFGAVRNAPLVVKLRRKRMAKKA